MEGMETSSKLAAVTIGYKLAHTTIICKAETPIVYDEPGPPFSYKEADAEVIASVAKILAKMEDGEGKQEEEEADNLEVLSKHQIAMVLTMRWPPTKPRAAPEDALDTVMLFNPELAQMIRRCDANCIASCALIHLEWSVIRDRFGGGQIISENGMVIIR